MKRVLYLSYDGMTDPLGQSQVIPYLRGLSLMGHRITIVSCEKEANLRAFGEDTRRMLDLAGIDWHHLPYTKHPPIISTALDLRAMRKLGERVIRETPVDAVHCRTVLSALVGRRLTRSTGEALIFDIRGFWADERVDGRLWNLRNPIYRLVYGWFKRQEARLYREADRVVTLTVAAKHELLERGLRPGDAPEIRVVPCCVDLVHFSRDRLPEGHRAARRALLGLDDDQPVLLYVGSLGTRYMLDPMLDLFGALRERNSEARFLFLTRDGVDRIHRAAERREVPKEALIVRSSSYEEVPAWIAAADHSVFFIEPGRSGAAVSPTKQAEILAMGLPIVCNAGIGDGDRILSETGAGLVLDDLSETALGRAADRLLEWEGPDAEGIRSVAEERLSLAEGIRRYDELWESL